MARRRDEDPADASGPGRPADGLADLFEPRPRFRRRLFGFDRAEVQDYVSWVEVEVLTRGDDGPAPIRCSRCTATATVPATTATATAAPAPAPPSPVAATPAPPSPAAATPAPPSPVAATPAPPSPSSAGPADARVRPDDGDAALLVAEMRRLLRLAEERAVEVVAAAEAEADEVRTAARAEAELRMGNVRRLRAAAAAAGDRTREEAARQAEALLEEARAQAAELLREAAAERDRLDASAAARLAAVQREVDDLRRQRDEARQSLRRLTGQIGDALNSVAAALPEDAARYVPEDARAAGRREPVPAS